MSEKINGLLFTLSSAWLIFFYARRAFVSAFPESDFKQWQFTWFAVTTIVFLAGNFWLFIGACFLIITYANKSIENKLAYYVILLIVLPPLQARIPAIIDISLIRLSTIMLLLPLFLFKRSFTLSLKTKAIKSKIKKPQINISSINKPITDKILIILIIMSIIWWMRNTSFTDSLRYGIVYFLEWFLPYYVASRSIKNLKQLKTVMSAFTIACMVIALIAGFEYAKSWLIYNQLSYLLNVTPVTGNYLVRGDSLRAQSTQVHALILGFVMMVSLGFYLYLFPSIKNKYFKIIGLLIIFLGLVAPLARGSWLCALILYVVFLAKGPKLVQRFTLLFLAAVTGVILLLTMPGGQKIINLLPFVGNVDKGNQVYREQLLEKSIAVINKHPFTGVADIYKEPIMRDMIQGQGIIDVVNSYLSFALDFGYPGLILYIWFFVYCLLRLLKAMRKLKTKRSELHLCGRALFATLVAAMVNISSVSQIGILPTVMFMLAGLALSYCGIVDNHIKIESFKKSSILKTGD